MLARCYHVSVSVALITAAVYCAVALALPASLRPPSLSSSSPVSSSPSPVAAAGRDSGREHYERNLLKHLKEFIISQLDRNISERTTAPPPVVSFRQTPVKNISIDGRRGEQIVTQTWVSRWRSG